MTDTMIAELEKKGFRRWTKANRDRLYINAKDLGLELTYYNTGNISNAWFCGERISNSRGGRYKSAKTFFDLKCGKLFSEYAELAEAAAKLIEEVTGEPAETAV